MTTPALPAMNDPFTTPKELATWVQLPDIPPDKESFADYILMGVAVVIRDAGSPAWTRETIPPRAKLLADMKAKNFYEHPTGAVSETVGPLSSNYIQTVLTQFELTDNERALLAGLVDLGLPNTTDGIPGVWILETTRGPLETHQARGGVITVPWYRGKSFPYYAPGALGSPE